jgi:hypothetical protein
MPLQDAPAASPFHDEVEKVDEIDEAENLISLKTTVFRPLIDTRA